MTIKRLDVIFLSNFNSGRNSTSGEKFSVEICCRQKSSVGIALVGVDQRSRQEHLRGERARRSRSCPPQLRRVER